MLQWGANNQQVPINNRVSVKCMAIGCETYHQPPMPICKTCKTFYCNRDICQAGNMCADCGPEIIIKKRETTATMTDNEYDDVDLPSNTPPAKLQRGSIVKGVLITTLVLCILHIYYRLHYIGRHFV